MAYDQLNAVNGYNAMTGLPGGSAQGSGVLAKQYATDATAQVTVSAITDARRTFEDARNLASRVKDIVGRMIGHVPEDPSKSGIESPAIFDALKSDAVDARQAINEAHGALARLESQLP